jgi:hypothetical protein
LEALLLMETAVAAPPVSTASGLSPDGRRTLGAIEGLPEDEREVFDLVGIQGLTHAETAAVVGVSAKTVQRRLNGAALTAGREREGAPAAWPVRRAGQSSPADARRPRPGHRGQSISSDGFVRQARRRCQIVPLPDAETP